MDGSEDKRKVKKEVILVQHCQLNNSLEEVESCSRLLKVVEPRKVDANSLVECLGNG